MFFATKKQIFIAKISFFTPSDLIKQPNFKNYFNFSKSC